MVRRGISRNYTNLLQAMTNYGSFILDLISKPQQVELHVGIIL